MFYVEARPKGSTEEAAWRPVSVVFGVGRWELDSAREAEAELRIWTPPAHQKGYELRIRRPAEQPKPPTVKPLDHALRRQQAKEQSKTNLLKGQKAAK